MPTSVPFDLPTRSLEGKVVVITGASRGLGRGMAARFAEHGASLGLCARTEPIPPTGARAVCASVDVTDETAMEGFAHAVVANLGPIDLWINNAGVLGPMGAQRTHDPKDTAWALLVNIGGVATGTRVFTRRARTWDPALRVLVNISSGAGRSNYEGWSIYGATKAAVDRLTQIVAIEEPEVLCLAVAPGVVETEMQVKVRLLDDADFPAVDRFRSIHAEGTANSSAWVADHLTGVLIGTLMPDEVLYRVPDEHPAPPA